MYSKSWGFRLSLVLCLALTLLIGAVASAAAAPARGTTPTYNLYFGDLHAHTSYSDGIAGYTPWDAYAMGRDSDADFMALTEH